MIVQRLELLENSRLELCRIQKKNVCTEDNITGWTIGESSFDSRLGKIVIFFPKASGPVVECTEFLIQRLPLTVYQGIQRSQREAGYSPVSSAEVHQ